MQARSASESEDTLPARRELPLVWFAPERASSKRTKRSEYSTRHAKLAKCAKGLGLKRGEWYMKSRCRIRLIDGEIITRDIAISPQDHDIFWPELSCLQIICDWFEPGLSDPEAQICLLPELNSLESSASGSHRSHATYHPPDTSSTISEMLSLHSTRAHDKETKPIRAAGHQPRPGAELDDDEQQNTSASQHDMMEPRSTPPDTTRAELLHGLTGYEKHSYIINVTKAYFDALPGDERWNPIEGGEFWIPNDHVMVRDVGAVPQEQAFYWLARGHELWTHQGESIRVRDIEQRFSPSPLVDPLWATMVLWKEHLAFEDYDSVDLFSTQSGLYPDLYVFDLSRAVLMILPSLDNAISERRSQEPSSRTDYDTWRERIRVHERRDQEQIRRAKKPSRFPGDTKGPYVVSLR